MRWALIFVLVLAGCGSKKRDADKKGAATEEKVVAAPADAAVDAAPAKPARPEHTVWKLVDNRHTAHRAVDDHAVDDLLGIGA